TDNEQVHHEQPGKVRRFRVYPSTKQKKPLRKWHGTVRWTYNQCLDAVEKKESLIDKMGKPWVLETPYDIRDAAWMIFSKHMIPHMHGTKKTIRQRTRQ
ncbi:hypothetical protein V1527DRAFT_459231, partial [Lipomyces starkeyi]